MTPYQSGYTTNTIPPVDTLEPTITYQNKAYQHIFGCINWIATCTFPDIAPEITFIETLL